MSHITVVTHLSVTPFLALYCLQEHIMSVEHRIDVLVNNAGLLAKAAVVEAGMDHFRQVMETNFFGCLELIAAVSPQMMQRQSGGCRVDTEAA
jgi:NAD(P)-dependent dehydrogenase (short-subunit alcohol dehydrogenase family)